MPSLRQWCAVAVGMSAFSSCSGSEWARSAGEHKASVTARLTAASRTEVGSPGAAARTPAQATVSAGAEPPRAEESPSPAGALPPPDGLPADALPPPDGLPADALPPLDGLPADALSPPHGLGEPSRDLPGDRPATDAPLGELRDAAQNVDPQHLLVATARETLVYERPSFQSPKIGYLRAGAQVRRDAEPAAYAGCKLGFYRIMPEGYVCVGVGATLDPNAPVAQFARVRPDRSSALPYRYGRSLYPTPPFYTRLPNRSEQQQHEVELGRHLEGNFARAWRDAPSDPTPPFLAAGGQAPTPFGYAHEANKLVNGRAVTDSSFALLAIYEHDGRRFGLSPDMSLLPLDRMKPVVPSAFHGLALGPSVNLPVVFVRAHSAFLYEGNPKGALRITRPLAFREAVPVTGTSRALAGLVYLETTSGDWIRDDNLVRVDRMTQRPGWVRPGRTWIHVSILKQTLVAYEGDTPTYVTLVSTGADGLGDPATTHSTVRGRFLIHTKHVTATMDSDEVGDEFDLRDVPYVQYFSDGFAFHAAYWHDEFGSPHSHGCVNLSPIDSRWLFHWTDPPVPQAWHGAMSLHGGTLVYVSP